MSSDNGIYLGEFPLTDGGKEYRVIHAQAIDNLDFGDQEMQDHTRVSYFGDAFSYLVFETAWEEARLLASKVTQDFGFLEYGIQLLAFDRPLLNKTVEEADEWLKNKWNEEFPPVSSEEFLSEDEYQLIEPPPLPKFLDEDEYQLVEPPSLPKLKFSELRSFPGMNGFPANVSDKKN